MTSAQIISRALSRAGDNTVTVQLVNGGTLTGTVGDPPDEHAVSITGDEQSWTVPLANITAVGSPTTGHS